MKPDKEGKNLGKELERKCLKEGTTSPIADVYYMEGWSFDFEVAGTTSK